MEQIFTPSWTRSFPNTFKAHPGSALNYWSAACATGSEPITIAMALNEAGWFEREKINIFASDASPRAIEAAAEWHLS
jgi:chemotaxis protein methyltransferase CheR